MNENLKITFRLETAEAFVRASRGEADSLSFDYSEGNIICRISYDFNERPITLKYPASVGDTISVVMLPYRVELYVNDVLHDEDWPAGNRYFSIGDNVDSNVDVKIEDYVLPKKTDGKVIGTFKNAEGWRPDDNMFAGDCMPYSDGERYHVIFLKDRRHHGSKWGLGAHQWYHVSTADFDTWDIHPMAVEITDYTEGSICTGSMIKEGDLYYLYYTIRMHDWSEQPIRRSVSTDGYHFEKDPNFEYFISEKYHGKTLRDPKVVKGEDGIFHMFLTTSLVAENKGCLVHLTSTDLFNWKEEDEPIFVADDSGQPECPDYVKFGDYYYLIFSPPGSTQYRYSKEPFTNWITPKNPIISVYSVPKCAVWGDKLVFTGSEPVGGWGGNLRFRAAHADENGELVFE